MARTYRMRIPKWLWLALALVTGCGAAFSYIMHLANGVVVGDLWGVSGQEHHIAVAQHQGRIALLSSVLLQFAAAGALFGYMDRESYRVARIVLGLCPFPRSDYGVRNRHHNLL